MVLRLSLALVLLCALMPVARAQTHQGGAGPSPLPAGAATSALQPRLGVAGIASPDVLTIQGNPAGVPIPVSLGPLTDIISQAQPGLSNGVNIAPTAAPGAALPTQASAASVSNVVAKASGGNLYTASVIIGATSGWLVVLDATSLPNNGALTGCGAVHTNNCVAFEYPVLSNGTTGGATFSWAPGPVSSFINGIVLGFSSTGPRNLTASATAAFTFQVN